MRICNSILTTLFLGLLVSQTLYSQQTTVVRPLEPIAAKLEPSTIVTYKTVGDKELGLHIFNPTEHKASDTRAAFVSFHGGGWSGGFPRRFYPFVDHFTRMGLVGISVEYRLLKRDLGITVFDCVKDARSAIRYIRAHASELGIDPNKLIVSGGSAGAHLAAGTALFDGIDEPGDDISISTSPNVMILYYPVIDTSLGGYGNEKIGARWRELSPVDNVRGDLPPTLLLHGTGDTLTPFAGAKRFAQEMLEAGNDCQLIPYEGGRHGYLIFDLDLFNQAMDQTELFLRALGMLD